MTPATIASNHPIPPMTHPLSKGWDQPDRADVLIDEHHAVMSQHTFYSLKNYSGSFPTGVYEGKMWRRHQQIEGWLLVWYDKSNKPGACRIEFRPILILVLPVQPSDLKFIEPMGCVFKKAEAETIALNIIRILSRRGNTWRELGFEEYCTIRKGHGASEQDMVLEKPYFDKVLPYTVSEEKARTFSPCWNI